MSAAPLLPPEDLAQQLSIIEILLSIYQGSSNLLPLEGGSSKDDSGDIILTSEAFAVIKDLAEFLSLPLNTLGKPHSVQLRDSLPAIIQVGIRLDPLRGTLDEDAIDTTSAKKLILNIGFAIRRLHERREDLADETLRPRWSLKQADWIDRTQHEKLCTAAASIKWTHDEGVDYIMNVIEAISEATLEFKSSMNVAHSEANGFKDDSDMLYEKAKSGLPDLVLRSWYYLPSLSMKDKRKDLVSYANQMDLTGFVLAGKPGLVVLECDMSKGEANAIKTIDTYWSNIKTTSWSDLPSSHKKVSERYCEKSVKRSFNDIKDIIGTEELGGVDIEEGGRIRTPDLDKLRIWLQEQGCTGQLDIVLGKET